MIKALILIMGLLAMAALIAVAWWLWVHNPEWPWATVSNDHRPAQRTDTGGHRSLGHSPAAVEPRAPLPTPQPLHDDDDNRRTVQFVRPQQQSDHTQILPEMANFVTPPTSDVPQPRGEQLRTRPVRRAPRARRRPPQPPRS